MQACAYCGRENEDIARHCSACGTDLTPREESAAVPPASNPPQSVDLAGIQGALSLQDGFSRPEWPVILKALREHRTPDARAAAWTNVITQWAGRWEMELGEDFWLTQSGSFFLVSALDGDDAERLLQKSNKLAEKVRSILGPLAWEGRPQILIVHIADDALADRFYDAVGVLEAPDEIQSAAAAQRPPWMIINGEEEGVMPAKLNRISPGAALPTCPCPTGFTSARATS